MNHCRRIAFVANNTYAPWGGSEELWSLAALRLIGEGFRVLACVQNWQPLPRRVGELAAAGASVHVIRPRKFARLREKLRGGAIRRDLQQVTVEEVVRPFKPDLVVISQMQNYDGAFWADACRDHNLPYVLVAQAASEFGWPEDYIWHTARRAHQDAKRNFFVSQRNATLTERQLAMPLPKREVVQNPFSVGFVQPAIWPSDPATWRLACVARLEPAAKGHDLLLELLALPKWRERPLQVSFYGTGRNGDAVRGLAAQLNLKQASFRGHTMDVAEIWRHHHGLILASRLEGTPLSLIEAMLCHRVAVVTDVGGNAELIEEGKSGFVADTPSLPAVDAALERAWVRRHDWREMGLAAGQRVRAVVPEDPPANFARRLASLAAGGQ